LFTYDAGTYGKGRLTGASDANHSMSWVYDALGRVTSKSQQVGGVNKSVAYAYTNGNLTTLTTPSGQTISFAYNGNHQVSSVSVNGSTLLSGVTYEPFGVVSGWTWGNGTTNLRAYDTDQKVSQISSGGGVKGYTYDDAFRIIGITDSSPGASNWTYGYDALDRLTSAANGSLTRGWTYDANGNRLSETGSSPAQYQISSSTNQVSSVVGTSLQRLYSYDAAGNTTSTVTSNLQFNNRGRLQVYSTPGTPLTPGTTVNFIYNALGQMVQTSGTAATVQHMYDESGHLLGEYDGSGNLIQETVWLGAIPVATLRPSGATVAVYYIHTDHLNAPRAITRPSDNEPMWTWFSDPFGTVAPNNNPQGAGTFAYDLRFPGQVTEALTGLTQNVNRDYDPLVGRYVESDPIGLGGGVNTYGYVGANPLSSFDPLGLSSLIFNPATGTITVVNGLGQSMGDFPAANNTTIDSRGAWPPGATEYGYPRPHPEDTSPDGPYGPYGLFVFKVPGCSGCGVHSGRKNVKDKHGHSGVQHVTEGCIRTIDQAMALITALIENGDPLTGILVTNQPLATNLPPVAPGLQGGPPVYRPDPSRLP
jgi:RHS repeat-associated protein